MAEADELERLERELLEPAMRRDRARVEALLAEEFQEFGSSGQVWDREQTLAALAGDEQQVAVEASGFTVRTLGAGAALVTYRTRRPGGEEALRCSVWVRRAGRWQMVFHQGTPAGRGERMAGENLR